MPFQVDLEEIFHHYVLLRQKTSDSHWPKVDFTFLGKYELTNSSLKSEVEKKSRFERDFFSELDFHVKTIDNLLLML